MGGINMLHAIADYNTVGYFTQNIRRASIYGDVLSIPETILKINMMQCVSAVMPLILKYRGTGKIQAIMQPEKEEVRSWILTPSRVSSNSGIGVRLTCRGIRPITVPRGHGDYRQAGTSSILPGTTAACTSMPKPPFDRVEPTKVDRQVAVRQRSGIYHQYRGRPFRR